MYFKRQKCAVGAYLYQVVDIEQQPIAIIASRCQVERTDQRVIRMFRINSLKCFRREVFSSFNRSQASAVELMHSYLLHTTHQQLNSLNVVRLELVVVQLVVSK